MFFDEKAGKDPLFRQKWAGILKMCGNHDKGSYDIDHITKKSNGQWLCIVYEEREKSLFFLFSLKKFFRFSSY